MRVVARFLDDDAEGFKAAFVDIASRFAMDWSLRPASQRRKVVALVSKFDHCLGHLHYASRIGETYMDVDRKSTRLNSSHQCAYRMPPYGYKTKYHNHTSSSPS